MADVSWFCPLNQLRTQTVAAGTPGHTWLVTAQGKSPIAHKGMHMAGSIMANTMLDLIEDPALLAKCKEDYKADLGDRKYATMMEGYKPSDFRYE
jgi:aminobenzoyl-glutamate utilization protein B